MLLIYFYVFKVLKVVILHSTGLCAEEVHLCGEAAAIDLVTELLYMTGEEVEVLDYVLFSAWPRSPRVPRRWLYRPQVVAKSGLNCKESFIPRS